LDGGITGQIEWGPVLALEAIITRYGLLAILAGAGIEGEAVVITGGILAHRGLLPIWGVAVTAAIGSCLIDQLWFLLGRYFRNSRWVSAAKRRPAFQRALHILEKHPTPFILAFRFIYGMRTVSPIAIGTSAIPARTFVPLNMVAAAVWGPAIAWLGYLFGKALDPWLHDVKSIILIAAGITVVIALGGLAVRSILRARRT
jgi:membrane protein DedA with SNARE-associated domain